jgi:hypothetical protein
MNRNTLKEMTNGQIERQANITTERQKYVLIKDVKQTERQRDRETDNFCGKIDSFEVYG